jgi:threonine synthase
MTKVNYVSTRNSNNVVLASQAILKGISEDGGLFVPQTMPKLDFNIEDIVNMSYQQLAYQVMKLFFTDFTEQELKYCIDHAYDSKFDTDLIAPLVKKDGVYFLELFHGKTLAFKDMALSILPYLLKTSAKKNGIDKEIVILTATSGDTGKAALEGFADVEGTKIIVFFPEDGVSDVQKRQMTTQEGKNTCVVGIHGNFDDAQSGVKAIFTDRDFAKQLEANGYMFSSANSINIGRLVPQVVYYFYAYAQLVKSGDIRFGEQVNFTVPTGNFGNILAGFYAKSLGLPVDKFICASNDNKVLYDFFRTGVYDRNRKFMVTVSPSMDILISSNLERLLYHVSQSQDKTKELMENLSKDGKYAFDIALDEFYGEYATEAETFNAIKTLYDKEKYVMDTHTAVAYASYCKYVAQTKDNKKNIIVSTASPYKFTKDVMRAIDEKYANEDAFVLLDTLSKLEASEVPAPIKNIDKREIRHKSVCEKHELKDFIKDYLKLS